jgi:hypothetical protein
VAQLTNHKRQNTFWSAPLNPAIDKWGMDGSCQTAQGYVKLFDFEVAQMASRAQQVTDGRAT